MYLSGVNAAGIMKETQNLKHINRDLRPAYLVNQALNSAKTAGKDALIITAGAAGTAGATLVAANKGNIKEFAKNLVSKFKPSNLQKTFTAEKIKNMTKNIKGKITSEKLSEIGPKIKKMASVKNIETVAGNFKNKISSKMSNINGQTFKNLVNKAKGLPTPAKAVLAAGAALTALFVVKNRTDGAYKAGQTNQKYQDMSRTLDKFEKR